MKRQDFNQGKKKSDQLDFTPLFKYSFEDITAAVILDIRSPKENDTFPVKFRVTHNRRQTYYPCMNMTAEFYDKLHGEVRKPEYAKPKRLIQEGFKKITDTIEELAKEDSFSHEGFAKRLSKGTTNSLFEAFDNRITELDGLGKVGSSVWYSCAKSSIKKFTSKDLKFSDITPEWLKRYEASMREGGKEFSTISINMRALRAIMNIALREGIIKPAQYPFEVKKNGKYRIPEGEGRKIVNFNSIIYHHFS